MVRFLNALNTAARINDPEGDARKALTGAQITTISALGVCRAASVAGVEHVTADGADGAAFAIYRVNAGGVRDGQARPVGGGPGAVVVEGIQLG